MAAVRNLSITEVMDLHVKPACFPNHGLHMDENNLDADTTVWVPDFLAFLPLSCKEKFLFLIEIITLVLIRKIYIQRKITRS